MFTKNPFFRAPPSHKHLTLGSLFWPFLGKRRPPSELSKEAKNFPPHTPPADCRFRFSHFLLAPLRSPAHSAYIFYTHFSKFKTILLGQAAIFVGWRTSVGGFYVFCPVATENGKDVYFLCCIMMMIRILTTI